MDVFCLFWTVLILHSTNCFASEDNAPLYKVLHEAEGGDILTGHILYDNDAAFVGGENHIVELVLFENLPSNAERVEFAGEQDKKDLCEQFSPGENCENVVILMQLVGGGRMLICGSNGKEPKCYYYTSSNANFQESTFDVKQFLRNIVTPNVVSYSIWDSLGSSGEELYIGPPNGIFFRIGNNPLDTDNTGWFKDPEFKGIIRPSSKDFVYIFFNEKSSYFVGEEFGSNPKEDYYSMVGRICRADRGGTWKTTNFMTFRKVRLLSSWPSTEDAAESNYPHDELVSVAGIGSEFVALFRTNRNWKFFGYAVAIFDTNTIDDIISGASTTNSEAEHFCEPDGGGQARGEWFSKTEDDPFKPGMCPMSDSYTLRDEFEKFALRCPLVKSAARPVGGKASFASFSEHEFKFVVARKLSVGTDIFLFSESGFMKKIVYYSDGQAAEVFEKQMLAEGEVVMDAMLIQSKNYILLSTATKIVTLPFTYCEMLDSCHSCNGDPHCNWDVNLDSSKFMCKDAAISQRSCSAVPAKVKNLVAELGASQLQVSWEKDPASPASAVTLISVVTRTMKDVAATRQTRENSLEVQKSSLQLGGLYDVIATSVDGITRGMEVRASFTVAIMPPVVKLATTSGVLSIGWSEVPGAARYIVKITNMEGEVLQDLSFSSTPQIFVYRYHGVAENDEFNVSVWTESNDGIQGRMSERVLAGPQTDVVDLPDVVVEPIYPQGFDIQGGGPGGAAAAAAEGGCTTYLVGMGVAGALAAILAVMTVHNMCTITTSEVTDADGARFQRQFLLIWSKTSGGGGGGGGGGASDGHRVKGNESQHSHHSRRSKASKSSKTRV